MASPPFIPQRGDKSLEIIYVLSEKSMGLTNCHGLFLILNPFPLENETLFKLISYQANLIYHRYRFEW